MNETATPWPLQTLRFALTVLLLAFLVGAGGVTAAAWRQAKTASKAAEYVSFPNASGVRLPRPKGFTDATSFDGFQQASSGASVMVTRLPGPYAEVTRGFTAEQMAPRGMRLASKKDVTLASGDKGLMIGLTQTAQGITFGKWIVAFGGASETFLVTATFPNDRAKTLSAPLKVCVLGVRRAASGAPPPKAPDYAGLPWTLTPPPNSPLVRTKGAPGKTLLFTKGGAIPAKSPSDPLFIAASSLGGNLPPAAATDRKAFAQKRFGQMAQTSNIVETTTTPLTLDSLPGFETIGTGKDAKSGTPLALYQTLLFTRDGGYVLFQGLTGQSNRDIYLPAFKTLTRTFKQTQP